MSALVTSPSKRILILSSKTGGGHESAAQALRDSFLSLSPGQVLVNITQVLEEAHFFTRSLASAYNYLLRYHQHYMRYYYGLIQKVRPYESHILFQLGLRYGTHIVERLAPNMLVSVHPMTQHFFVHVLRKLRLLDKVPLITVVTDPCAGFWKGWACPEVSQYFVASEEARAQLVEYGVPDARIQVSGMPVHSRFRPLSNPADKIALRQALHLDPDRFTVLINAGWVGGGNVPALYEALMASSLPPLQIVFLAGNNVSLKHEAEQLAQQATCPVRVVGFTDRMDQYMNAADVLVSKLGGLTTFEAMACQLPILADCLTPPMPQEAGTANYIAKTGAGRLITTPYQIVDDVTQLIQTPDEFARMQAAARTIGQPGAVDRIAGQILAI